MLFPGKLTATSEQGATVNMGIPNDVPANSPSKYMEPQKQTLFHPWSIPDLKLRPWIGSCVCVMMSAPPSVWMAPAERSALATDGV